MGWVVNTTPRPLYSRERPAPYCIGGWVNVRAGLNGWGKSRPPPGFDPQTVQPVPSRYTDWVIPAPIYWSQQIFLLPRGHNLLCCPHSLLNGQPNFSWRFVKIVGCNFFSHAIWRTPWNLYMNPRLRTAGLTCTSCEVGFSFFKHCVKTGRLSSHDVRLLACLSLLCEPQKRRFTTFFVFVLSSWFCAS